MTRRMTLLLCTALMINSVIADEPSDRAADRRTEKPKPLKTEPDALPAGILKFNGMLVGRLAAKDVEKGTFTVRVDAVPRVWRNSQAENPRSLVGKTVLVEGVFGKFLDVLVVTRTGETLEFECKHNGDALVFPGELLRKVAPFDPADYPLLPERFRGYEGRVAGSIVKKDPETFELIVKVERVIETSEKSSAKDPSSIEGKSLMLAGFWNRRDAYHALKAGDRIEVGMRHIGKRSEHLTVTGNPKKMESGQSGQKASVEAMQGPSGFRGILVGRLVEKDIERGTFTVTVDAVPRVWKNNRAKNPRSLIGTKVAAGGVSGRLIDALVVTRVGETIEYGALHEEGDRVRVVELLRKVGPVKPGDYPVLPEGFRGFQGMVTARVIRKGDELLDLVIEVEDIDRVFEANRAEKPQTILGKRVTVAGFWKRKEEFHAIRPNDRIRIGLHHQLQLSDHVNVIESLRRLEKP